MHKHKYDTLISVVHTQIASLYNTKPINFNPLKVNPPSQTMEPIKSYATVLMGWKSQKYKENMKKYGCAYHGGDGKTGFFEISGLSTIDIDREDDFLLVERIIKAENIDNSGIEYYGDSKFWWVIAKANQDLFDGSLFLKVGKTYRIPTDLSPTGQEIMTGGGEVGSVTGGSSSGGSSGGGGSSSGGSSGGGGGY